MFKVWAISRLSHLTKNPVLTYPFSPIESKVHWPHNCPPETTTTTTTKCVWQFLNMSTIFLLGSQPNFPSLKICSISHTDVLHQLILYLCSFFVAELLHQICVFFNSFIDGDFLIVPWLVLGVFTVVAQVQSLVKEWTSHKPCGTVKKKKKKSSFLEM